MRAQRPDRNLYGHLCAGRRPRAASKADLCRLGQSRGRCYAVGFLRPSIKRDCLRTSANSNPYPVGQLDELHERADLLNMLFNVGRAKKKVGSEHDRKGRANKVRGDIHRER